MRLVVVQTGRLREAGLIALRDEYVKRFARFGKLTVCEREPKGEAPLWPASARWKVALHEQGEQLISEAFARRLAGWTMRHGEVAFLVGAAEGHHPASLAAADCRFSLSAMVMPHQLAHLVLVEQLYRAANILAGTAYHRG